jgi:proline iminopeptidase
VVAGQSAEGVVDLMPFARVNGTEIFHLEVGEGVPCLVMHGGLGADHSQFREGLDPLGDVLRLVYYDHRGNGRSGRPPIETLTLEQLASDADALRAHLGLEKMAVLGHSYGGCLTLQYALRYPDRVSHLLLVGTTAAWDYTDQIVAELQERAVSAKVLTAFLDVAVDDAEFGRGQKLVAATLGFHTFDPERAERLFGSTVWSPTACARSRELMADCNVVSRLGEIQVPTLILAGRHDFFCPPSQADRMHRGIRGSEKVVFEQSGHYPFVEEAEMFRDVLRRWIASSREG